MQLSTIRTLSAVGLLMWATVVDSIELGSQAVGNHGELYQLRTGTLGELFGEEDPSLADNSCLALEATPNGEQLRFLVPSTASETVESNPRIAYQSPSGSAVILWESVFEGEEGDEIELHFVVYDGEFSEISTATHEGLPARMSDSPLVASTSDSFELDLGDELPLTTYRNIIHLVWQREQETWYTPLLFVEGMYVGWNDSFSLDASYFGNGEEPDETLPPLPHMVSQALELGVTSDESSILVAFANTDERRIGALRVNVLPLELALLSDEVRLLVLERANQIEGLEPGAFGDEIRAEIIVVGSTIDLNPAVVAFVADQVRSWLVEALEDLDSVGQPLEPGEADLLSDAARDVTIDVTSSLYSQTAETGAGGDGVIEIVIGEQCGAPGTAQSSQILDIEVRSDFALPDFGEINIDRLEIMTSHDGQQLLLAWTEVVADGETPAAHFVQTTTSGGNWSQPASTDPDEQTTIDDLFGLLQRRLH